LGELRRTNYRLFTNSLTLESEPHDFILEYEGKTLKLPTDNIDFNKGKVYICRLN